VPVAFSVKLAVAAEVMMGASLASVTVMVTALAALLRAPSKAVTVMS